VAHLAKAFRIPVLLKSRPDSPELTDSFSNVYRTDICFSIGPKPDWQTPNHVVRRLPQTPGSSALRVPWRLAALPVLVGRQVPYLSQGRRPYTNTSIIGHLGIEHRSHSWRASLRETKKASFQKQKLYQRFRENVGTLKYTKVQSVVPSNLHSMGQAPEPGQLSLPIWKPEHTKRHLRLTTTAVTAYHRGADVSNERRTTGFAVGAPESEGC
jgi:hypothetical protein